MLKAELPATASDKLENAKGRLGLAGDYRAYIRQQMLSGEFEKHLQPDKSFGHPSAMLYGAWLLNDYQRIMKDRISMKTGFYAGSHDWSDFNIHLSPELQNILCNVVSKRVAMDIQSPTTLELHMSTCRVDCAALMNQYLHFGEEVYRVEQGESSMIRATDLFNNLSNKSPSEHCWSSSFCPAFAHVMRLAFECFEAVRHAG